MRTITVSTRDLLFAIENRAPGVTHYLDKTSGDVMPVFSYNREQILAAIKKEPDRYLRLAPQSGSQGYKAMADFTRTVRNVELRRKLEAALNAKNAFHNFRAVIDTEPTEQTRWLRYRGQQLVEHVRERLRASDIEMTTPHDEV
jgi:hypothetical protein